MKVKNETQRKKEKKFPKTQRLSFAMKQIKKEEDLKGVETREQFRERRIQELATLAATKKSNGFIEREKVLEGKGLLFEQLQKITNNMVIPPKSFQLVETAKSGGGLILENLVPNKAQQSEEYITQN